MNYLLFIFIFCIVLFMYLHIYYNLKVSNDLEVYEIELPSKDKLEEICNLRQPVIFEYQNQTQPQIPNTSNELIEKCNLISVMENYGAFDIQLRNLQETDKTTEMYLPFILNETVDLFKNDTQSKYITENNSSFLEETTLVKTFKYNDSFLRPNLVSKCNYDFISASKNVCTPLKYNNSYRNFFFVTQGHIKIKLIPPMYSKYLYEEKDYLNYLFTSPVNVWDIQSQPQYKNDFEKVKSLDVELKEGQIIFIPPYWWYSIQFEMISSICVFQYRTYMNTISIFPSLFIHTLQKMNVKREVVEKYGKETIDGNNKKETSNENGNQIS